MVDRIVVDVPNKLPEIDNVIDPFPVEWMLEKATGPVGPFVKVLIVGVKQVGKLVGWVVFLRQ